jgi:ATP-dependent exoDNAse (exonuclease V) beta subunit
MNLILAKIKGIFPYHKILLAYYSGSIAYGINDEQSDKDVTVVLEDFRDNIHLNLGQVDLFIFSKERFLARHNFDETITAYHRASTDTLLSLDKTLIHLDPSFKETVDKVLAIDHKAFLTNLLKAGLEYGKARFDIAKSFKSHYHFLRYRGMIEHFELTGKCELICPEPWHSYMIDYKNNWDNIQASKYYQLLEESIEFIENYIEGMT